MNKSDTINEKAISRIQINSSSDASLSDLFMNLGLIFTKNSVVEEHWNFPYTPKKVDLLFLMINRNYRPQD